MRRLTAIVLTLGVLALGACSTADATADTSPANDGTTPTTTTPAPTTTPVTSVVSLTPSIITPFRPTQAVDPGMVLSGHEVVTSAEVGGAMDAAANG